MGVSKDVERPAKRVKVEAEQKPTSVVNPYTPFRKEDGTIRESSWTSHEASPSHLLSPVGTYPTQPEVTLSQAPEDDEAKHEPEPKPQIFTNLNFYINGSTIPTISDHKLRRLISEHGGGMSIALGRRTVTHVILSKPSSSGGCGGGLAGTKIQKEVARQGGKAMRYVTAEWVIESIEAGKRLPESRFDPMRMAPVGVNSIASMMGGKRKAGAE